MSDIKLILDCVHGQLVAPHELCMEIRELASSPVSTYVPSQRSYVTVREYTMDTTGRFLVGLWRHVRHWLKERGHTAVIEDRRVLPCTPRFDQMDLIGVTPFPFQVEAVTKSVRAINGIVKATTAAGKSACIFLTTQVLSDIPILVLSYDKKIVAQLAREFESMTGEAPGLIIAAKQWKWGRVTFATFSQLEGKLHELGDKLVHFKAVIVDEVHAVPSRTRMAVMAELTAAYWRIGYSATPFGRTDGKNEFTIGATGPQVFEVTATEMIDLKRVARPDIKFVVFDHPTRLDTPGVDHGYEFLYKRGVVNNTARNRLVCDIVEHRAEKPCLVFAERLSHVRHLEAMLNKRGMDVRSVTGETPLPKAEEYIARLNKGLLDVIVTNKVMNAGVSVPHLASVVIASAGKANIATVQRLGRPMRRPSGKEECEYWDIFDRKAYEDHPRAAPTTLFLESQAKARMKDLRAEGHDVQVIMPDDTGH